MMHNTTGQPVQNQRSWRSMLRARPLRNLAAAASCPSPDQTRITVPRRRRPVLLVPPLSWLIRPNSTRTIVLDQMGTQVWLCCDGQRDVEQVVGEIAGKNRLSFHEARVAVTSYIKMLVERGALAIERHEED